VENKTDKLRQYYNIISGLNNQLKPARGAVGSYYVDILAEEIKKLLSDFPDIVRPFEISDFDSYSGADGKFYYKIPNIKIYLVTVLGSLSVFMDRSQDTPITEKRDFTCINDPKLRRIIERDYSEIQRAYISSCWKSVIILSGSAMEAILADLLLSNSKQALSSQKAPNKNNDIKKWTLNNLINVAVDLELVPAGIEKMSHTVREYRNLVHPGLELRKNLKFDAEEARIAIEVLNIVQRDLS